LEQADDSIVATLIGDEQVFYSSGAGGDNGPRGIGVNLQPGQAVAAFASDVIQLYQNGTLLGGTIPKRPSSKITVNGVSNPITYLGNWAYDTTGISNIVKVFDTANGVINEMVNGTSVQGPIKYIKNIADEAIQVLNLAGLPIQNRSEDMKNSNINMDVFYSEPIDDDGGAGTTKPVACYKTMIVYNELPED
jgi:hypothetical protein